MKLLITELLVFILLIGCAPILPKEEVLEMPYPVFQAWVYDEISLCRTHNAINTGFTVGGLVLSGVALYQGWRVGAGLKALAAGQ